MSLSRFSNRWSWGGVLVLAAACSDGPCFNGPCPLPATAVLTLTSATSTGIVTGATVQDGPNTIPCQPGSCVVLGYGGTHQFVISAPGFQNASVTAVVNETDPKCGCPTVDTAHLNVVLVPTSLECCNVSEKLWRPATLSPTAAQSGAVAALGPSARSGVR